MFAQAHTPEQLTPNYFDTYLEQGWFRMGQTIFTTNFIHFKSEMYSTIWLRILLDEYEADSTHVKLVKRNALFRTSVNSAEITPEKEELYLRYKESLPFQPSESLHHLLFGKSETDSIYTTFEVTVYDGNQLIACGFFDLGQTSAEGITSFYDPAYKKHSLGKYLIYLKIQYCKNLGLRYFYPGYFVPGYSYFDYKLAIARTALQFLQLSSHSWLSIAAFSEQCIPFEVMQDKLKRVHDIMVKINKNSRILKYEFFDANLIAELRDTGLFDFPVFLFGSDQSEDNTNPIVLVYDVRDNHYHLLSCSPIWKPGSMNPDERFYSAYFLKAMHEIYTTTGEEEMAYVFMELLKERVM